ncbi:TonB C-terminal domain-containing protein [Archangium lansingense]|uniref:TonB C-terminal domain-containing protein n=1 Tax=Archangium lansingense TaxID=2995310 RepID=A0ABT4AGP1_9BACT|nr:TonB C-terminal domain-containing protein [Archangium lansinium]MCY1080852.1 TonB C-terminal domain-containing protein [Archangium lansinium]
MPDSRRRLLLALLLSFGLHVGVWLWMEARRSPLAEQRPLPPAPATLQFVEVEVAPPPEPPKPTPPSPPPPKPPRRPLPSVAQAPKPPPSPAEPPAITAAPPAGDSPRADVPRSEVPRLDAPQLLPSPSLSWSPDRGVSVLDAGVPGPSTPEEKVADMVMEGVRRGRVDRGLVHPYFSELGKSLLKNWDAERAVSAKGLQGFLDQTRGNSKEWMRVWSERASAYANTGSVLDADTPEAYDRLPPGGDASLEARRTLRRQMKEQFRATRRATVRVVQDTEGRLLSIELVTPSNDIQIDREAVADIRNAAASLPVPPPEALQGRTQLVSLWQIELIISISPPVPTVSIEFDAEMKLTDLRMPLDRRLYKRVRLLEVR